MVNQGTNPLLFIPSKRTALRIQLIQVKHAQTQPPMCIPLYTPAPKKRRKKKKYEFTEPRLNVTIKRKLHSPYFHENGKDSQNKFQDTSWILVICRVVAEFRRAGKDVISTLWDQIHFFSKLFVKYYLALYCVHLKMKVSRRISGLWNLRIL